MTSLMPAQDSSNFEYTKWVPLLTPAIKEDALEVDKSLMLKRIIITTIAIAAIAISVAAFLSGAGFSLHTVITYSLVCPEFLLFSIIFLDIWQSERSVDSKAVDEYINQAKPSEAATSRIQSRSHAAKLLIAKGGDVNKRNEKGRYLLDGYMIDFDSFKTLVSNGADLRAPAANEPTILAHFVGLEDSKYLEYFLNSKKVTPDQFTPAEQAHLWTTIGSAKTGQLLKQYGFDVNAKDKNGYTPLLKLIGGFKEVRRVYYRHYFPAPQVIEALLDCGADPLIEVGHFWNRMNALQLALDPTIKKLLEQRAGA